MDNMTAGQELLRQKEDRLKVMENALLGGGLVSNFIVCLKSFRLFDQILTAGLLSIDKAPLSSYNVKSIDNSMIPIEFPGRRHGLRPIAFIGDVLRLAGSFCLSMPITRSYSLSNLRNYLSMTNHSLVPNNTSPKHYTRR